MIKRPTPASISAKRTVPKRSLCSRFALTGISGKLLNKWSISGKNDIKHLNLCEIWKDLIKLQRLSQNVMFCNSPISDYVQIIFFKRLQQAFGLWEVRTEVRINSGVYPQAAGRTESIRRKTTPCKSSRIEPEWQRNLCWAVCTAELEIENTINKHSPESQCCFQGYVYLGLQVPLVTRNWTMKIESLWVKHQIQWTKLARNSVPSSKSRSIRHWLQVWCSCCFITYLGLLKGERAEQRRSRVKL